MSEKEFSDMIIKPINMNSISARKELSATIDVAVGGIIDANRDMSSASNIQKRGYTYQGDSNSGFGFNSRGLTGQLSPYGRGMYGGFSPFCLQPFGIGAQGILTNIGTSTIFNTTGANTSLNSETRAAHTKMAFAVEAYKGFGIVKNVIDLMCNFASEGLSIQHPRPGVRKFYERWAEAVDLQGRVKDILRYYYKFGNVFIYTTMGKISDNSRIKMMSTRGDNNDPANDDRENFIDKQKSRPLGKRLIPWRYTLLNPFQMDLVGSKFFGESKWVFVLDEETFSELKTKDSKKSDTTDLLNETDINLPPEFKTLPKDDRAIELNQDKLWILQYMKDDHEDWADPMIWPVMNDIMYKHDLRAMDRSVIDSTINAITIYKLGKIEQGVVATPAQFKQFAQLLRTPTASHNIVWNDAISMESVYPPIDKILGIEKYRSVDKDILAGLGIPGILVDGQAGGSYSNAFMQVRTLLERLEDGRTEVMKWVKSQLRMVSEIMGHRDIPNIKFGQMSLRDEQAEKQLIIQLLDRNVISAEAVHEVFGLETIVELERIKRESQDGIIVKHGPFSDPMTDEIEQIQPQQNGNEVSTNGRPPGTKNIPQKKKRDTKPQGMGLGEYEEIRSKSRVAYEIVEKELTDRMIRFKDVKYWKSLCRLDKEELDCLIELVFSNINLDLMNINIDNALASITVNKAFTNHLNSLGCGSAIGDIRESRIIALAMCQFNGD